MRCLIVDDNASFLEASRSLLERQGASVVGVAANGSEALQRARELRPDVILVDIDLGEESGFAVARQLTDQAAPEPRDVILISTHPADDFVDLVAQSPALGFIPKSELSLTAIASLLDDHGRGSSATPGT